MEKLLTIRETAKILKTNVNFVYDLINKGKIPYVSIGSLKIRESALDEFIRSHEIISTSNRSINTN